MDALPQDQKRQNDGPITVPIPLKTGLSLRNQSLAHIKEFSTDVAKYGHFCCIAPSDMEKDTAIQLSLASGAGKNTSVLPAMR